MLHNWLSERPYRLKYMYFLFMKLMSFHYTLYITKFLFHGATILDDCSPLRVRHKRERFFERETFVPVKGNIKFLLSCHTSRWCMTACGRSAEHTPYQEVFEGSPRGSCCQVNSLVSHSCFPYRYPWTCRIEECCL